MTLQIETRPPSRDQVSVAIILLAAGKASRMGVGGPHKLLAEFAGVPLVRRSAERAVSSGANPGTVVTGFHPAALGTLDRRDRHSQASPDSVGTARECHSPSTRAARFADGDRPLHWNLLLDAAHQERSKRALRYGFE